MNKGLGTSKKFIQIGGIDDCAEDGGKEFFTKMHCVL